MPRLQQTQRMNVGSQYEPHKSNDISMQTSARLPGDVFNKQFDQMGYGFGLPGGGLSLPGSGFLDRFIDKSGPPGFKGEHHAMLKMPDGRLKRAEFMGPGTHLEERLRRGDTGISMSDRVAMAHDSRYGLATSQAGVREADKKMVAKLKDMRRKKQDSNFNIQMGMRPIQAKMLVEKAGLVKPGRIASFGDVKPEDRALVEGNLKKLEQEGFGILPGDVLKMKLLKQTMRKRTKNRIAITPRVSGRGELFAKSSTKKHGKCCGKGLSLPGGRLGVSGGRAPRVDMKAVVKMLTPFISGKVLPFLLKTLSGKGLKLAGQGMPKKKLNSLLHMRMLRTLNDGASRRGKNLAGVGVKDIIKKLKPMAAAAAKTLLPILMQLVVKKLSGTGQGEEFADFKKRIANPGIMARLGTSLSGALFNAFKKHILSSISGKKSQTGAGFGSFFKGFKKGFMKVAGPALKIAKTLAPLAPLLL